MIGAALSNGEIDLEKGIAGDNNDEKVLVVEVFTQLFATMVDKGRYGWMAATEKLPLWKHELVKGGNIW
ncbi:hypothetical protein E4U52_000820 [Claviceps spartinae]|nr:hypothetical protein E4U52_000820 [Claviceps spartinae]KAG6101853.1 hypothetical protein E4U30_000912 [Claviceps sp. LM220 group G6]KAG6103893.1 hypothetical protein E4U31_002442 [Claviceps sp. LM219 group G6]